MHRLFLIVLLLTPLCAIAQHSSASDPFAISLAQGAVKILTGGAAVSDVTLNGSVNFIVGSDNETGSVTLEAKGTTESRVDLALSGGTVRSDVRNIKGGTASGAWKKDSDAAVPYAGHNCLTDAVWFFPAMSSLTQTANPSFVFKYIGQEQHRGVSTQHIRVFQPQAVILVQNLTTIDFYLDPATLLPLAISFPVHPDLDASTNIPEEVLFADYRTVNGIRVPFSIQRLLNNTVLLDLAITSAAFNTGLQDNIFNNLQ